MKNVNYILGVQSYANHDSGASILKINKKNNTVDYVAISEERLTRKKYSYTFPTHSINYCMEYFGLKSLKQIDYMISDWIRIKRWIRSGPSYNYQMFDYLKEKFNFNKKKIIQIDHHLAHAASTYYSSGYKNSAILIADGNGSDLETNSFFHGYKNQIILKDKSKYHGIGAAYSAVTNDILNFGTGGEGKTMGLAPYGNKNGKIKLNFHLKNINTSFSPFMRRMPYSDVLNGLHPNFRPISIKQKIQKANKKNIMKKYFCDWAYKIQKTAETVMLHLGKKIYEQTKTKNICLAGGVALNSVANNVLLKKSKFKNMFVFPASSDAGIPFGLVLWGYHYIFKGKKRIEFNNAYTGCKYNSKDILQILKRFDLNFSFTNNYEIAKLIKKGFVIGNFQDKSEYGPRALGNRSILADARNPKMRNYINRKVKHREVFRPFAPAILEEFSEKYFDISYSPYMLQVAKCKKSKKIPAAIHIDNTARVQTVNEQQNKKFYSIIKEFYHQTGVPVILNTSFNDAGEPLVETPLDAILCFLKTKIDYLVLNNVLISKKKQTNISKKIKALDKLRKKTILEKEKKSIKMLTKGFSLKEYNIKKKIETKKAKTYVLDRPVKKIEYFLKKYNYQTKPLLIIGAPDHTKILFKIFKNKIGNSHFLSIKKNDIIENKTKIEKLKYILNYNPQKYYKYIFISSFEYLYDIVEKFDLKNNFFTPYDNSSRSIMDFYYIKKFSNKSKIQSKNLLL